MTVETEILISTAHQRFLPPILAGINFIINDMTRYVPAGSVLMSGFVLKKAH